MLRNPAARARLIVAAACAVLALGGWFASAPALESWTVLSSTVNQPPDVSPAGATAADAQAERALASVEEVLRRSPPSTQPGEERRSALAKLDVVMRDEDAAKRPAVQAFYRRRIEEAVARMATTRVNAGAVVWKMYNHGFVVRTAAATLCFDLVRPRYLPGFRLDADTVRAIAAQCDILFVSHAHADHAENTVAGLFLEQGRPVVAPKQVGYRRPVEDMVTRLERNAGKLHEVAVRGGQAVLRVVVFPGRQGDEIDNNVVLVTTPDDITVVHTGDQWDRSDRDFAWMDRVRERFRVDILLPNGWTYDIARMVRGFDPALVIPGHENELGHVVEKRIPHAQSFERKAGPSWRGGVLSFGYRQPMVVMAWGESYNYSARGDDSRTAAR